MSSVISRRVVNASPLILLTEVGLLQVLRQPRVPVLVPDVVLNEIGGLGPSDPTVHAVRQFPSTQIVSTSAIPDAVLVWDLDAGESAVLAVALEEPILYRMAERGPQPETDHEPSPNRFTGMPDFPEQLLG
jgi:predicted nucleic acid-binding protein